MSNHTLFASGRVSSPEISNRTNRTHSNQKSNDWYSIAFDNRTKWSNKVESRRTPDEPPGLEYPIWSLKGLKRNVESSIPSKTRRSRHTTLILDSLLRFYKCLCLKKQSEFGSRTLVSQVHISVRWCVVPRMSLGQKVTTEKSRALWVKVLYFKWIPSSSSKSPWRNRLARSAVNRKVGGSSPPGDDFFLVFLFVLNFHFL